MKTLEELYSEVINGGSALKDEASAAAENGKLAEFAAKYGVSATEEEFSAFLSEKENAMGALSDDDLESAAGGMFMSWRKRK